MRTLTLHIDDKSFSRFAKSVKKDFVLVENGNEITVSKKKKNSDKKSAKEKFKAKLEKKLRQAFKEVREYEEGKIELKDAKAFLNEL